VAASIREFGFRQPIVVDEDGVIIVGHTRYKAARKLGLEEVPVHVAVGLTPAQAKAYRLTDNQTATLSAWESKGANVRRPFARDDELARGQVQDSYLSVESGCNKGRIA
jgi:ParB-like chromosome segregation protein Spo0J